MNDKLRIYCELQDCNQASAYFPKRVSYSFALVSSL